LPRSHVPLRPHLRRAARLSAAVGLCAAVVVPAFALPAKAEPVYTVRRGEGVKVVPVAKRKDRKVHTVKSGETLSGIAKAAKLPSWRPLWDVNAILKHPDVIEPGWKLRIPARGEVTRHRPLPAPSPARQGAPLPAAAPRRATTVAGGSVWDRLAQCESGGNWSANTGNGFSGGLQFSPGTWRANGGSGSASNASRSQQIAVAQRVLASQGWGAWPACSSRLGLR
jgi:LysM repeat protein